VRAIEDALKVGEGSSDDTAPGIFKFSLAVALVSRDAAEDRQRGLELLTEVRDLWLRGRNWFYGIPLLDISVARERARGGDYDGAIPVMRQAVAELHQAGRIGYGVCGGCFLVETLLGRGTEADAAEAEIVIDRLANLPSAKGFVMQDVWLLRLRALLAHARGDEVAYRDLT